MKFSVTFGFVLAAVGAAGIWWVATTVMHNPVEDLLSETTDPSPENQPQAPAEKTTVEYGEKRSPKAVEGNFVGSAACKDCHQNLWNSYQTHPMSVSLARSVDAGPLEDYDDVTTFRPPKSANYQCQFEYRVERDEKSVRHLELILGADNEELGQVSMNAEYAVGSGKRGRSYLMNHGGLLYMSPITWYSQNSQWDLSPAYSKGNLHFERRIIDGCVGCHAGRTAPVTGRVNRYQSVPFHEQSIGCERCHGPGDSHISFHDENLEFAEKDPIVNPADFSHDRLNDLCFQCHLHGAGRVVHHGMTPFDFQPGDRLSDIWTVLIAASDQEEKINTEAATQGEQMMASECYKGSQGKFGCVSCHDPHSSPSAADKLNFYRTRCLSCHDSSGTECSLPESTRRERSTEDSCIQCHMPKMPARNVPHTALTDHRVLRDPSVPISGTDQRKVLEVYGNEDGNISEAEVKRARAIIAIDEAERSQNRTLAAQIVPLLAEWVKNHPDDLKAVETLGSAYVLTYDVDAARQVWELGLKYHPESEELLRHLMVFCHDSQDISHGIEYARRLIRQNPWHSEYHGRLAHMLAQSGQLKEAVKAGERSVELSPWEAHIHGWLSESYSLLGQEEQANRHRDLFRKLSPVSNE